MAERNVIFRAKRKLNGHWVEGSLIQIGDDWCQIVPSGTEYDDIEQEMTRVISSTVGEYMNLKDKNGKFYCEDDIVKYRNKNYLLIKGQTTFMLSKFYESSQDNPYDFFSEKAFSKAEIIGNIHDNPELLD